MSCFSYIDNVVRIKHGLCGILFQCQATLCKYKIKRRHYLLIPFNGGRFLSYQSTEFCKYCLYLFFLFKTKFSYLVIEIHNGLRLNKECGTRG